MAQQQRGLRTEELMRRRGSQASELSHLSATSKSSVGDAAEDGRLDMESVGSPQVAGATKGRRGRKSASEESVDVKTEAVEEPEPSPAKRARGGLTVANVAKRGAQGTAVRSLHVATRQAIQGRSHRFKQVR